MNRARRLRELHEAATPGPWTHDGPGGELHELERCFILAPDGIVVDYPRDGNGRADENAAMIVAARNALPALLAVAEAANALLDAADRYEEVPASMAAEAADERRWEALRAALAALESEER